MMVLLAAFEEICSEALLIPCLQSYHTPAEAVESQFLHPTAAAESDVCDPLMLHVFAPVTTLYTKVGRTAVDAEVAVMVPVSMHAVVLEVVPVRVVKLV